jgi:hypothetical protein
MVMPTKTLFGNLLMAAKLAGVSDVVQRIEQSGSVT